MSELSPCSPAGDDLQHIANVLSDPNPSSGLLQGKVPRVQRNTRKRAHSASGRASAGATGSATAVRARSLSREGSGRGLTPWHSSSREGQPSSSGAAGPRQGAAYDQPSAQSTCKAWFCEACECWVPCSGASSEREQAWRTHAAGGRHRRQAAAAAHAAARRRSQPLPPPKQDATRHYRSARACSFTPVLMFPSLACQLSSCPCDCGHEINANNSCCFRARRPCAAGNEACSGGAAHAAAAAAAACGATASCRAGRQPPAERAPGHALALAGARRG